VLLSHDRSCNLSCPSCRKALIVAKKTEQDRLNLLAEEVLLPMLRDARSVKVTGSGDPFGSNHFRHLLKRLDKDSFPNLTLEIQTNGQLLNESAWAELRLDGRVERILVSIDAARSNTYTIVRRGGTLRKLLRNLVFLRNLRQESRIGFFQLDYVVHWLNYREIPTAVDLARRLKADRIYFQLLRNWGTYTVAEFELHNIANPAHAEYQDFLAVLRDPRLEGDDVDLGNMKPFVDEARQRSAGLSQPELHEVG
jgi:MoaA/NifB/PqqE/SkfB family radical SAM enzyme